MAWVAQAGAAFAEEGEGMFGGCCYQQKKLLSGKAELILMTQDTNTKHSQSWDSNYMGAFARIRCGKMISHPAAG